MSDVRPRLEIIQGGGPTPEEQMHAFAKQQGIVIQKTIEDRAPTSDVPSSLDGMSAGALYAKSLRSMNRVFIAVAAHRRFKLAIPNDYSLALDDIGFAQTLQPAKAFENSYFSSVGPTNNTEQQRIADIMLGARASLLLWHTLARANPTEIRKPSAKLAQHMQTSIDGGVETLDLQTSRLITSAYDADVDTHIKQGMIDFMSILTVNNTHHYWDINNFVDDSTGRAVDSMPYETVISPLHYSAGALLVASQIKFGSHLKLIQ